MVKTFLFKESDDPDSDSETVTSNFLKVFFVSNKFDVKPSFNVPLCIDYPTINTLALDLFQSEITSVVSTWYCRFYQSSELRASRSRDSQLVSGGQCVKIRLTRH